MRNLELADINTRLAGIGYGVASTKASRLIREQQLGIEPKLNPID
jgi:hypothetical protein